MANLELLLDLEDSNNENPFDNDSMCKKVNLRIVTNKDEVHSQENVFHPIFMHQMIDNEICLDESVISFNVCFSQSFNCSYTYFQGKTSEEVEKSFLQYLPNNTTDISCFEETLSVKDVSLPGREISAVEIDKCGHSIYTGTFEDFNVKDFYSRIQILGLLYIDASSVLENDDPKWNIFTIFRKLNQEICFVGYAAVYHFYAFPDKIRARVGQFLILPSYQKRGIGKIFLREILKHYHGMSAVLDITLEDATDEFQHIWDLVNCEFCMNLPLFKEINSSSVFDSHVEQEFKDKFKVHSSFAARVFEILKLRYLLEKEKSDEVIREDILNRLCAPMKRERTRIDRIKNHLSSKAFSDLMCSIEQREYQCSASIDMILEEYYRVESKLGIK